MTQQELPEATEVAVSDGAIRLSETVSKTVSIRDSETVKRDKLLK